MTRSARLRRGGAALLAAVALTAACSSGDGADDDAAADAAPARTRDETVVLHPAGLEQPLTLADEPGEPAWTLEEPGTLRTATSDDEAVYALLEGPGTARLVAADPRDGTVRWTVELDLELDSGARLGPDPLIMATAAVVADVVVVALYDEPGTVVIGVDRERGEERWAIEGTGMPLLGTTRNEQPVVLFRDGESELALVDPASGEETMRAGGGAVATNGAQVFVAGADGTVEAFDLAGRSQWRTEPQDGATPYAMTATADVVVVGTALEAQAYAAEDGERLWTLDTSGVPDLAAADGLVLVGDGVEMAALDRGGDERWRTDARGSTLLVLGEPERAVRISITGSTVSATDTASGALLGEAALPGAHTLLTLSATTLGFASDTGTLHLLRTGDLEEAAAVELPVGLYSVGTVDGGYLIPGPDGRVAFHPSP